MRLSVLLAIFLENYQLSHSQDVASCEKQMPDVSLAETTQVGEIILRLQVDPGERVQIEFDKETKTYKEHPTDIYEDALQFSPADGSNQRKCVYQANHTADGKSFCDLKLAMSLDPEVLKKKIGNSPVGQYESSLILFFNVRCYFTGSQSFTRQLIVSVILQNEFQPAFKKKLFCRQFHIVNLVKGFQVLDLAGQATDGDVGQDGNLAYGADNGTDLIGVEETKVVLQRNITVEDVSQDPNLYFNLTVFDNGSPRKTDDTIFVLTVLGVHGDEEDRNMTGSKADEDRNMTASENDRKNIKSITVLAVLVGVPAGIAALVAAALLTGFFAITSRRAPKDEAPQVPQEPKDDPALPPTAGVDLTRRGSSSAFAASMSYASSTAESDVSDMSSVDPTSQSEISEVSQSQGPQAPQVPQEPKDNPALLPPAGVDPLPFSLLHE